MGGSDDFDDSPQKRGCCHWKLKCFLVLVQVTLTTLLDLTLVLFSLVDPLKDTDLVKMPSAYAYLIVFYLVFNALINLASSRSTGSVTQGGIIAQMCYALNFASVYEYFTLTDEKHTQFFVLMCYQSLIYRAFPSMVTQWICFVAEGAELLNLVSVGMSTMAVMLIGFGYKCMKSDRDVIMHIVGCDDPVNYIHTSHPSESKADGDVEMAMVKTKEAGKKSSGRKAVKKRPIEEIMAEAKPIVAEVRLKRRWYKAALFPKELTWDATIMPSELAHADNVVGMQLFDLPSDHIFGDHVPEELREFQKDAIFEITGLKEDKDLNGCFASVLKPKNSKGLVLVKVEDHTNDKILIQPINLRPATSGMLRDYKKGAGTDDVEMVVSFVTPRDPNDVLKEVLSESTSKQI